MIFYGMSGMETQVAVTVISAAYTTSVARTSSLWDLAGLAPLARPEFVLRVAPRWPTRAGQPAGRDRGGAASRGAVVAPWIVFTTAYYGSPIPNTVVAKATVSPIRPS